VALAVSRAQVFKCSAVFKIPTDPAISAFEVEPLAIE